MNWLRFVIPTNKKQLRNFAIRWIVLGVAILVAGVVGYAMIIDMPRQSWREPLPPLTDAQRALAGRLRAHVDMLGGTLGERNVQNAPDNLERAAVYIEDQFTSMSLPFERQEFEVGTAKVRNIIVELRGAKAPEQIVVVGAHYDSADACPAANDNGSGVAALLEIARHFQAQTTPALTLRFVAFVNEEPPYSYSDWMGSLVYARSCRARNDNVVAMLSLETIGYYSDAPGSQHYPPPFSNFYPDTGNFIGFVGNMESADLVRRCVSLFREHAQFPSEGVAAPGAIQGIGWSDHWSFWQNGYPGVMVTDTAPFRYPHYHQPTDTPDKLEYEKTARVVEGLARVIAELSN